MEHQPFEFYARCAAGFEPLLTQELKDLGIEKVRPLYGGVVFFADLKQMYRACLWLRTASRVLLVLDRVNAKDADALYEGVKEFPWEQHIGLGKTLSVFAHGTNAQLRNTQFTSVKVKDAICDRLRRLRGVRPDVDAKNADVSIDVTVHQGKATIALNVSGQPLHRRGYRKDSSAALVPLKETLAASVVMYSGWKDVMEQGGVFVDPMCGTGTTVIEAAMMAADMAPGIMRSEWGFDGWTKHDEDLWNEVLDEADERAEAGLQNMPRIIAGDIDPEVVEMAQANAKRAGLASHITFYVDDACRLDKHLLDKGKLPECGVVVADPPYGERLAEVGLLPEIYGYLAKGCEKLGFGWKLGVITPDDSIDTALGLVPVKTNSLYNGAVETLLRVYQLENPPLKLNVDTAFGNTVQVHVAEENTEQFAGRLRKVARERAKWAKTNDVYCYRVYDSDLPDYAVAVDLYHGAGDDEGKLFARVTEYAPPETVDAQRAQRRFHDAVAVVGAYFELPPEQVFSKTRRHDKGGGQYRDARGESCIVCTKEAGYNFEVDLNGYLDTGIFLDHRDTRCMVGEMAQGKDMLNLFAYTGTATVHAAGGEAKSTTTVDMSQTYLNWAQRNMEANGFDGEEHRYVRADVTKWVYDEARTERRYDLIFCDPPTFSNSKNMGERTWSIQRDHVKLLAILGKLLTADGIIVFSCNLRNFKMDYEALAEEGLDVKDITKSTIPHDFERNPKIHHCFLVTRGENYVERPLPPARPKKAEAEGDKPASFRKGGDGGYRGKREGAFGGKRDGGYKGKRDGNRSDRRDGGYKGNRNGGYRGKDGSSSYGKRDGGYRGNGGASRYGKDGASSFVKRDGESRGGSFGGQRGGAAGYKPRGNGAGKPFDKRDGGNRKPYGASGKGEGFNGKRDGGYRGKGEGFNGKRDGSSFPKRDGGYKGDRNGGFRGKGGGSSKGGYGNFHGKRPGSPRG